MTERQERMLRIERTFDAPADAVFEAWTSEEVLRRWLHAQPDWDTPIAEVDLRVGGSVRVVMRDLFEGLGSDLLFPLDQEAKSDGNLAERL